MTFKQHLLDLKEVFVILSQIPDETQPFQMCFRYQGKKISWVFISSKGIEPNLKKNSNHTRHDAPTEYEGSTMLYRAIDCS